MHQLCQKLVKKGVMSEFRPCMRPYGHTMSGGGHTPDLTDMQFGNLRVLRPGPVKRYGNHTMNTWVVFNEASEQESTILTYQLTSGGNKGTRHGFCSGGKKKFPEYGTVRLHYDAVFNLERNTSKTSNYKGMPFFDEWNPQKGGAFWKGAKWITVNLGKRPGPEWSMDIIKHELGFVPGNLRWALKRTQEDNKQHRLLGQFTDEEFAVEAKRRGYVFIE